MNRNNQLLKPVYLIKIYCLEKFHKIWTLQCGKVSQKVSIKSIPQPWQKLIQRPRQDPVESPLTPLFSETKSTFNK